MPQLALLGGYTRTNHVEEFGIPGRSADLSRHPGQLSLPGRFAMADLHRRPHRRADAGRRRGDRARSRRIAKPRAPISSWISPAPTGRSSPRAPRSTSSNRRWRASTPISTDVRNQLNVGLVPPSDVFSLEAQQARQQMLLIEAQNIAETSAADFRRLVGLSPDAAVRAGRSNRHPAGAVSAGCGARRCGQGEPRGAEGAARFASAASTSGWPRRGRHACRTLVDRRADTTSRGRIRRSFRGRTRGSRRGTSA